MMQGFGKVNWTECHTHCSDTQYFDLIFMSKVSEVNYECRAKMI